MNILSELNERILVGDGAIGTFLYEQGYKESFEAMNLTSPDIIQSVHEQYVQAGADIIQSNTYAANRIKLEKYGLEDKVSLINREGVKIAKQAARPGTFVLATIGGVRGVQRLDMTESDIREALEEQATALLEENPDGIMLETFYDVKEAEATVEMVRSLTTLPIIAQLALGEIGVMHGGTPVTEAFDTLEKAGADVVGVNCRMGPYHIIRSLEGVSLNEQRVLSAYPNASMPAFDDGRVIFQSNPDYFYEKAKELREQGVRLIGGCCGTTPEHIHAISRAVKGSSPLKKKAVVTEHPPEKEATNGSSLTRLDDLVKQEPTVIVELDPPKKLGTDRFLEGAKKLHESGAAAVTMADNSLASPRVDNVAMGALMKTKTQARPLLHVNCRDRNLIGLQSHLLGIHALGIQDILAITGDPTKVGDFPGAASVYDVNSFHLISLLKEMNEGRSFSGKSLGEKTSFTVAAAFNPNVRNLDRAVKRLEKKIAYGADYFITQPVYGKEQFKEIYESVKHLSVPVYIGIMPLVSGRNAEFLHNEVPGITLTDEVRRRMAECGEDRDRAKQEGIAIAKSLIDEAIKYFKGIYLITPFLHYDTTAELTSYIRQATNTINQ
ncbi:bifunctional homocysteine S-methyltransferase/methylenetetrahydrofolate reductase [Alteribacillus iranensis]|uniref:Homocysteine S-methyltransferase n=1 Tax=Alteribacillus iranensis TaxID=930128 RepID=A0A1I1ZP51_9BACI|nr:bifunctional homocysteine S-methyltransferase/methylenetetrahydrofolate reductase [Alteribacillus iranensis]SFE33476.1 homocysteine S-methyltransferase [Alteribacillus iranensis]